MRCSLSILTLAAVVGLAAASPLTSRQSEAARFGSVSVSPQVAAINDTLTITYNATTALAEPVFLDLLIQGTRSSGFVEPYYYLLRDDDFPAAAQASGGNILTFKGRLPVLYESPTNGYDSDTSYLIWAFITYNNPDGGALTVGGTSTPIGINLD